MNSVEVAQGASALASGLLFLQESRTLVAADAHFGYEDAIGAVLPMWSTREILDVLLDAIRAMDAREVLLLGDAVHSTRLSDGAVRAVRSVMDQLRARATLTIVAGNHEGKTRGAELLGETVEFAQRGGRLLLHGDRPPDLTQLIASRGVVIGHLHPSVPLGGDSTAPAFLANDRLIVVPALTPYSNGLNVCSQACRDALQPFLLGVRRELHVVATTGERCYAFGTLSTLRSVLSSTK